MPAPWLLDLSHTSHTRARTGIQRVARSLLAALGPAALPITHDPARRGWRLLEAWEQANLHEETPASKRGARWPVTAKLRGHASRLLRRPPVPLPPNTGLIVPEVFSPVAARALSHLLLQAHGPRVALLHDALALKFPELTPAKTVARFPAYLVELLAFDGIAAVSADSRAALLDYWRWLRAPNPPPVEMITLGLHAPTATRARSTTVGSPPIVLAVGSIEGRKNHLALLEACEQLWERQRRFVLHVIGIAHAETGATALARLRALQAAGRPLQYHGPVTDNVLTEAYAGCAFTVYASLAEGFGLPVIESLAHGRPCICSARGALGESARGGGCLALEAVDAASLAAAMERLLTQPAELDALAVAAHARRFKSWTEYTSELTGWMRTLPRRPDA